MGSAARRTPPSTPNPLRRLSASARQLLDNLRVEQTPDDVRRIARPFGEIPTEPRGTLQVVHRRVVEHRRARPGRLEEDVAVGTWPAPVAAQVGPTVGIAPTRGPLRQDRVEGREV